MGLWILVGVVGLSIGSFVNVLIARLPHGEHIGGRSKCPNCRKNIAWYDMIPLVSFVALHGRCRFCNWKIPWRYPAIELITAFVFCILFWTSGKVFTIELIWWWVASAGFIALAGSDLEHFILPDGILIFLALGAVAFTAVTNPADIVSVCVTGFLLALGFGILFLVSRGMWLGLGDVKLSFVVGLILGYPLAIVAVLGAIWSAALVGIILVAIRHASFKSALPFGTFLAGASIITLIYQHELITFAKYFFSSPFI